MLGISKQAAGKTIDSLERLDYVFRERDSNDGRRMLVRLTDRGVDCLAASARIFEHLRGEWEATLGESNLRALEDALRMVTAAGQPLRLDVPGWFAN
ncbi:MarR family winged helix-turn-helix transcriptional regulator [Skermania sp. ID1734]|uniref:MarR family winged helix-turn-helix transcriptional regulator n=1 Tax=Skermania sp. ID1734 TaxID=2597516 RepID=UPI002104C45E|nr:MarR family winged helix-turn-helix transcriptional regulator [Skermania sp. ID1734]